MSDLITLLLLAAQTSSAAGDTAQAVAPTGSPIPAWGWITIVVALAGTVTTLAGFTWRAVQQTIKRADEEQRRDKETNDKLATLLERAITAFQTSQSATEMQTAKHEQYISEVKEMKEEIRRVGEKIERQ